MMPSTKKSAGAPFKLTRIAAALALATAASQAGAIVADGKLDATYQLGYTVGFIDDKGIAIGDGELYFGIDSNQFLYFRMPTTYVDNRYGDYTKNAFGWGDKGHTFDNLLGSDKLGSDKQEGFVWNGNSVEIDYIAGVPGTDCIKEDKKGNCKEYNVGDYLSGGLGTALNDGATQKNDGSIIVGSTGGMLEIATSLEYNFASAGATSGADGNANVGWIEAVGYEIEFADDTFDSEDWLNPDKAFTLISIGNPHVSPSKKKFDDYEKPECIVGCTPPPPVPEPGSMALLGAGLLGMLAWARRRGHPKASGSG